MDKKYPNASGDTEKFHMQTVSASDPADVIPAGVHIPVMLEEVTSFIRPCLGGDLLDGTLGGGGHAVAMLEASGRGGRLVGLDRDQHALTVARQRLAPFVSQCVFVHANFSQAAEVLRELEWNGVDGVLLDLGFSSLQIEAGDRGFSFLRSGPLDMRMDQNEEHYAADIVNYGSQDELQGIFREFGEERAARALARAIIRTRSENPITTTTALVEIIERVIRPTSRTQMHPATRAFQALRIAVNQELQHLETFLREGYRLLRPMGRMLILSYHSLEDRLVKKAFRRWASTCICPSQLPVCVCGWTPQVRLLTTKPLTPRPEEVMTNPRARSARLRVVEKRVKGEA